MELSILLFLIQVLSIHALIMSTWTKPNCSGDKSYHRPVRHNQIYDDSFLSYRLSRGVHDSEQFIVGGMLVKEDDLLTKGCHNWNTTVQGFELKNSASALGRPDLVVVLGGGVGALVFVLFF